MNVYTHISYNMIRIGNTSVNSIAIKGFYKIDIKNDACPRLLNSVQNGVEGIGILTLQDYLDETKHVTESFVAEKMLYDLGNQIKKLLSMGMCIANMSVDDIVVIKKRESDVFTHSEKISELENAKSDPVFIFLNDTVLFDMDENEHMIIDVELTSLKKGFISPELFKQIATVSSVVPSRLHFKSVFHSLAQLILYFLLNVKFNHMEKLETQIETLNPIKNTRLYWCLCRCMKEDHAQRCCIYI